MFLYYILQTKVMLMGLQQFYFCIDYLDSQRDIPTLLQTINFGYSYRNLLHHSITVSDIL